MKKTILVSVTVIFMAFLFACGGGNNKKSSATTTTTKTQPADSTSAEAGKASVNQNNVEKYDPKRGQGKFDNFKPGAFNAEMAAAGQKIYETKCIACHKLTNERLVGPGWKGVTKRHTAAWILNFVTNTDAMLEKDPYLKQKIEICMVRMPDQNLSDQQAKEIYQFMRKNDGDTK